MTKDLTTFALKETIAFTFSPFFALNLTPRPFVLGTVIHFAASRGREGGEEMYPS